MTVDEFVTRLTGRWPWIVLCVVLPVLGTAAFFAGAAPTYQAGVRVQVAGQTAASNVQAQAVVGQAAAVVTALPVVQGALMDAGVHRDAAVLADKNIQVNPVGTSNVLEIDVTDTDPAAARAIDIALAQRLVQQLEDTAAAQTSTALADLDRRIADASKQRAQAVPDPASPPLVQAAARDQVAAIDRSLATLESSRSTLLVADAERVRSVVIGAVSPTSVTAAAVRLDELKSPLGPRVGLAGIAGLVIGLAIAAALETLRPTVPGARRLANALGVPLAGSVSDTATAVGQRLARLAHRHGTDELVLRPLEPVTLRRALSLTHLWQRTSSVALCVETPGEGPDGDAAVVLLVGKRTRRGVLEHELDALATNGWPIVGVLKVAGRRHPTMRMDGGVLPARGPVRTSRSTIQEPISLSERLARAAAMQAEAARRAAAAAPTAGTPAGATKAATGTADQPALDLAMPAETPKPTPVPAPKPSPVAAATILPTAMPKKPVGEEADSGATLDKQAAAGGSAPTKPRTDRPGNNRPTTLHPHQQVAGRGRR